MDTDRRFHRASRLFLGLLLRCYGPVDAPRVLRALADELDGLRQWAESIDDSDCTEERAN
jgi:hypothetical protein